jgi:hypothetical protein
VGCGEIAQQLERLRRVGPEDALARKEYLAIEPFRLGIPTLCHEYAG